MVKFTTTVSDDHHVLDMWQKIRSNIDDSHLSFSTDDGRLIYFNREICCALSPFLSQLVKGAFNGDCCCSNSETTIILPQEVSSKTVYDLQSLMIGGTLSELNGHAAKELRSLFSILGFESTLIKDESDENYVITVEHVNRIEDDRNEGEASGGDGHGGKNDEENLEKVDRAVHIETNRNEAVNDDLLKDDTVCSVEIGDDRANTMNDTEKVNTEDFPIQTSKEKHNTNSHEELEEDDVGSIEKERNPMQDYTGESENPPSASNKENSKEKNSDTSGAITEKTGGNGEGGMVSSCSEKRDALNLSDVAGNYDKSNMNCEVKLQKLEKNVNGGEGTGVKTRLRKKKNRNDSDGSEFNVSFDLVNISPVKKRQKRSTAKKVSYHKMELDTWDDPDN